MFAVVKTVEKEKSFFDRFKKAKILSQRIALPNKESFFIISAEAKGGKVPFEEILYFSKKLSGNLIFENNFKFRHQWNYTPWEPMKLSRKLLLNLALSHLSKARLNPVETSICLCDSDGIYLEEVHKLLCFAAKLHIVCKNKEIYDEKILSLLCEYGVSVTVSEKIEKADSFNVIVSPDSAEIPLAFKGLIFTNKKRPFLSGQCFSVQSIDLKYEYEKLRPYGIDKLTFASALFEKCNVTAEELILTTKE